MGRFYKVREDEPKDGFERCPGQKSRSHWNSELKIISDKTNSRPHGYEPCGPQFQAPEFVSHLRPHGQVIFHSREDTLLGGP